jgi:hypothetical protein
VGENYDRNKYDILKLSVQRLCKISSVAASAQSENKVLQNLLNMVEFSVHCPVMQFLNGCLQSTIKHNTFYFSFILILQHVSALTVGHHQACVHSIKHKYTYRCVLYVSSTKHIYMYTYVL